MALALDDLIAWFAAGEKPRAAWRIGAEHEKIGFLADSLRPLPYDGPRSVRAVLQRLAARTAGRLIEEDGRPIGVAGGEASVTLEPGGQIELSGRAARTVHEIADEVRAHLDLIVEIGEELDLGFLSIGYQPKWRREEIPWMPKARYAIMRRYMPRVGTRGLDMMLRTATTQANLDYASEADMVRKVRIGLCLQPIVTALFATSPFEEGRPSGFLSTRAACWRDTDPARTGIPRIAFAPDFGYAKLAEWALDVPMYFVIRNGQYIDCAGASFRAFMAGRLSQLPGERPTIEDWALHLSTIFTEVRVKQFIEMRGADAGPYDWIVALPALWKGLLYDDDAREEAWDWVKGWRWEEVHALARIVPRLGMNARFRGETLWPLAKRMLAIAERGLARQRAEDAQGHDERIYLAPLWDAVLRRRTQAEAWLARYHTDWGESIDPIFTEAAHRRFWP